MSAKVVTKRNAAVMRHILESPNGPVGKDMLKRGIRVQSRARRNLGGGTSGPKRVDTGLLRASIGVRLYSKSTGQSVRIGTDVYYSFWVHEGTGLYGPKHQVIKPRHARALVFPASGPGVAKWGPWKGKRVVKFVKGMKPNRFLTTALTATHAGAIS